MIKRKTSKIIAFLNLLIVFVLVTDNYLLPVKEYPASLQKKNIEYTKARIGSQGYSSYLITDQNGIQYNVSDNWYYSLKEDDHFTVVRTTLFNKAIKLKYDLNSYSYSLNIGVINQTFFGIFVLVLICLVCFIMLFFPQIFKRDHVEFKTTIAITSITIVAIFFYFYHQS